jgi:Zn-dependent protease with chaperone function
MEDTLRTEVERELVVETTGWAHERVARVTDALQRDVPAAERLETIVVWLDEHTAVTAPGRTIYFSRRLLERLPDDDAAAFVVAHEIAHHRLGHLPRLTGAALLPVRVALALLGRRIASPRREREADLHAIELCHRAGYDLDRCIVALEILEQVSLDYGDVDGVLGNTSWWSRLERGYPSLRERIEATRARAARLR